MRKDKNNTEKLSLRKVCKEYVDNPVNAADVITFEVRDKNGNVIRGNFRDKSSAVAFAKAQSKTVGAPLDVFEVTTEINSDVGDYSYDTFVVTVGESVKRGGKKMRNMNESYAVGEWDFEDFIDTIKSDIDADTTDDEIENLVRDAIDNACIYTSDCWNIAITFHADKFDEFDHLVGEVNDIETLAYAVLMREMYDYGEIGELEEYRDELAEEGEEE